MPRRSAPTFPSSQPMSTRIAGGAHSKGTVMIECAAQKARQHGGELVPALETRLVENPGRMLKGDQPEMVDRLIPDFLSQ